MNSEERKSWNEGHQRLTAMILIPREHEEAAALLTSQHALLHASDGKHGSRSYEDALLKDLREDAFRQYPVQRPDTRNSIAWHLWHSARIEDIAMNMLVAGTEQVLERTGMREGMRTRFDHSGNEMTEGEMAELSADISLEGLLAYRRAVAERTREIVQGLEPGQFRKRIAPERIEAIRLTGAVSERAAWLAEYWSGKTVGGLMLMPATRHHFVHLNKAMRIKAKLQSGRKA